MIEVINERNKLQTNNFSITFGDDKKKVEKTLLLSSVGHSNTFWSQKKSGNLCPPEAYEIILFLSGEIKFAPCNAAARNTFRGPKLTE